MEGHSIEPLRAERIAEAKELVDSVFPHQNPGERASFLFLAGEEKLRHRLIYAIPGIELLEFWAAISPEGRLDGISGLYSMREDRHEALWLGWFAVRPSARGQGVGGALLRRAIDEARGRGAHFLRLYTSDSELIEGGDMAQEVYERYGLAVKKSKNALAGVRVSRKGIETVRVNKMIRELRLR